MIMISGKFDAKKWQAESDADILAQYQEIMNDKTRKNAAIKAATTKANDYIKKANSLKLAAGGKLKKK